MLTFKKSRDERDGRHGSTGICLPGLSKSHETSETVATVALVFAYWGNSQMLRMCQMRSRCALDGKATGGTCRGRLDELAAAAAVKEKELCGKVYVWMCDVTSMNTEGENRSQQKQVPIKPGRIRVDV